MLFVLVTSASICFVSWVWFRIGKQLGARGRILMLEPKPWPTGGWGVCIGGVRDQGEDVVVTGLGATPQEAAERAFKHAATLMFPPSGE